MLRAKYLKMKKWMNVVTILDNIADKRVNKIQSISLREFYLRGEISKYMLLKFKKMIFVNGGRRK